MPGHIPHRELPPTTASERLSQQANICNKELTSATTNVATVFAARAKVNSDTFVVIDVRET